MPEPREQGLKKSGGLPLAGVRIVDLSRAVAGPFCTMVLGDLGAEIINIEEFGAREGRKETYATLHGESSIHLAVNRNKKSLVADISRAEGKEIVLDLLKVSDVLFNNFRPGVCERLGIDYEVARQFNLKIIFCSVTGFGPSGPYRERPAFDPIIEAISGFNSITGSTPTRAGIVIADLSAALFATVGVISALYRRETTGVGGKIEVSLLEAMTAMMGIPIAETMLSGECHNGVQMGRRTALADIYKTRDGHMTFMIGGNQKFWPHLCRALGHPELERDPRFRTGVERQENNDEIIALINSILGAKTTAEWMVDFVREGVPSAPVNSLLEALDDIQIREQQIINTINYHGSTLKLPRNPVRISDVNEKYSPPPTCGQDTREILSEILGYSDDKIAKLKELKIVG